MDMNIDDYEFDSDSEEDDDENGMDGRGKKKEVNDLANMLSKVGGDGNVAWTTEHILLCR